MTDARAMDRDAAAARLTRFTNTTPLVLAALPDHGSPALSARQIAEKGRCGAPSTVRHILNCAVRLHIAKVEEIQIPQGTLRLYTRAPAISPDVGLEHKRPRGAALHFAAQ